MNPKVLDALNRARDLRAKADATTDHHSKAAFLRLAATWQKIVDADEAERVALLKAAKKR